LFAPAVIASDSEAIQTQGSNRGSVWMASLSLAMTEAA